MLNTDVYKVISLADDFNQNRKESSISMLSALNPDLLVQFYSVYAFHKEKLGLKPD